MTGEKNPDGTFNLWRPRDRNNWEVNVAFHKKNNKYLNGVHYSGHITSKAYQDRHAWVPAMNFVPGYEVVSDLWWLHRRIEHEFESKMKSENTDDDYYANYEYNENLMSEIMTNMK